MIIIAKISKIKPTLPTVRIKGKHLLTKINKVNFYVKNIKREKNVGKGTKFVYYGEVVKGNNKRGKEYFSTANNLKDFKKQLGSFIRTTKK